MGNFEQFCENKTKEEVEKSLKKLSKNHRNLVKNYDFKFEDGVNLKGFPDTIGLIYLGNKDKKIIKVAAPWHYGREFAMMHEIGHLVWEKLLTEKEKKEWCKIATQTRPDVKKLDKAVANQDDEEFFCHAFAQHHVNNKIHKYEHKAWADFIKNICK